MNDVRIRGGVDPVEIAVVMALLTRESGPAAPSPYDRWREQRLRAIRRTASRGRAG